MLKIFKYLKSSIISVLVIIALLVVQAVLDLTLPDYTSKIVNVGVQQGGIENAAITQIGDESLNKLVLLLDDKDTNKIYNFPDVIGIENEMKKGDEIEIY